ncbi:MAG: hypothetical protein JWO78_1711, partial [Micavibrio sp.]|nr:hypothetical protein [Micavibrio sp.]
MKNILICGILFLFGFIAVGTHIAGAQSMDLTKIPELADFPLSDAEMAKTKIVHEEPNGDKF